MVGEDPQPLLDDMVEFIESGKRKIRKATVTVRNPDEAIIPQPAQPSSVPPPAAPRAFAMVARTTGGFGQTQDKKGAPGVDQPGLGSNDTAPGAMPAKRQKRHSSEERAPNDPQRWAAEIQPFVEPEADPKEYITGVFGEKRPGFEEEVAQNIETLQTTQSGDPWDANEWELVNIEDAEDGDKIKEEDDEDVVKEEDNEDEGEGQDADIKEEDAEADNALGTAWLEKCIREAVEEVLDEATLRLPRNLNISGDDIDRLTNQVSAAVRTDMCLAKYILDYDRTNGAVQPALDVAAFAQEFSLDIGEKLVSVMDGTKGTKKPSFRTITGALVDTMCYILHTRRSKGPKVTAKYDMLARLLGPSWRARFRRLFVDQVIPDTQPVPSQVTLDTKPATSLYGVHLIDEKPVPSQVTLDTKPATGLYSDLYGDKKLVCSDSLDVPPNPLEPSLMAVPSNPTKAPLPFESVPNVVLVKNYEPEHMDIKLMDPKTFRKLVERHNVDRRYFLKPIENATEGIMLQDAEDNERAWAWERATHYEKRFNNLFDLLDFKKENVYQDPNRYGRYDRRTWEPEENPWPAKYTEAPLGITPQHNELVSNWPWHQSYLDRELPTVAARVDLKTRDDAYNGGEIKPPKQFPPVNRPPPPPSFNPPPKPPPKFPDNAPFVCEDGTRGSKERVEFFELFKKSARSDDAFTQQSVKCRNLPADTDDYVRADEEDKLLELDYRSKLDKSALMTSWYKVRGIERTLQQEEKERREQVKANMQGCSEAPAGSEGQKQEYWRSPPEIEEIVASATWSPNGATPGGEQQNADTKAIKTFDDILARGYGWYFGISSSSGGGGATTTTTAAATGAADVQPDPNNQDAAYWFRFGPPIGGFQTTLKDISANASRAADRAIRTVGSPDQQRQARGRADGAAMPSQSDLWRIVEEE